MAQHRLISTQQQVHDGVRELGVRTQTGGTSICSPPPQCGVSIWGSAPIVSHVMLGLPPECGVSICGQPPACCA